MKNKTLHIFKNNVDDSHKEVSTIHFDLEQNAIKVIGEDTILFSKPVVITDNSEMWSGAKYDIPSLDISEYKGKLTADHRDLIQNILGNVIGLRKVANRKVTIDGLRLAVKENPLADYTKRMMMAGFITDFSIETIGPWPDDDGVFKNAKLVGLSVVVTGNNKQAHINQIAEQTMETAKKNGLDVSLFAQALKFPIDKDYPISDNNVDMFVTVKNTKDFAITIKYKNAAGDEVTQELKPGGTCDISTDQKEAVEKQLNDATPPTTPPVTPDEPVKPNAGGDDDSDEKVTSAVNKAVAPLLDAFKALEQKTFDNSAKEPEFKKAKAAAVTTELSGMNYRERHAKQINYAWDWLKGGNAEAQLKLTDINKFHLEKLQEKDVVSNAVTLGDFGNFVISPELLTDIEGHRSNFSDILAKFPFRDTLSLQMAFLKRSGDINMQEVEMCDDGADGNLKPISEYGATIETSNLHELAAVTPVCNAATRFLAVDLLGDVSAGYRNDFDRKKAQLIIARLQQAVDATGNTQTYATTSDVNALKSWVSAMTRMQEEVMGGVYIFNQKTYGELLSRAIGAGINTDTGFGLFSTGDQKQILGNSYVVVPNELMPSLNTAETKTFQVEGVNVSITKGVFYVDPATWSGRTSGGLNYDLSTEAAYEDGEVVKSAFQRNELVLRGSFFRGGVIRDEDKVVALGAPGVS